MALWNALFAPKGTPQEVIKVLNDAVAKGIAAPAARKQFAELGAESPSGSQRSAKALEKTLADDVTKWEKVIRSAGIKPNK